MLAAKLLIVISFCANCADMLTYSPVARDAGRPQAAVTIREINAVPP